MPTKRHVVAFPSCEVWGRRMREGLPFTNCDRNSLTARHCPCVYPCMRHTVQVSAAAGVLPSRTRNLLTCELSGRVVHACPSPGCVWLHPHAMHGDRFDLAVPEVGYCLTLSRHASICSRQAGEELPGLRQEQVESMAQSLGFSLSQLEYFKKVVGTGGPQPCRCVLCCPAFAQLLCSFVAHACGACKP